jgi:hypothetical protein
MSHDPGILMSSWSVFKEMFPEGPQEADSLVEKGL